MGVLMGQIHSVMSNDTTTTAKLSTLKKGELIKRKADAKTVWIKTHYDKETKTFCLTDFDDVNREIFLKGSTVVHYGFTF